MSRGGWVRRPDDSGIPITDTELADDLAVDPGEALVLANAYRPERAETWSEDDVLSDRAAADIPDILDHFRERTVPRVWWPEEPGPESPPC